MSIAIRALSPADTPDIIVIAEALPEWFDQDARNRSIPLDIHFQDGFVAVDGETIRGFITLYVAEGRVNIGWLGVHPARQREGIGRRLLAAAEDYCSAHGCCELATATLGEGVTYEPYAETRAFYFANGFEIYQRSQTDNPNCREEIRIRRLLTETPVEYHRQASNAV